MAIKDSFINETFKSLQDSVLTVKESYLKNNRKRYILECSVCSKDEELWPYGSINSTKYSLQQGNIPCGCSKNTKWKEWQWEIRIKRKCEDRGYTFTGFSSNFKGGNTKLNLYNPVTGNNWSTLSADKLIQGQGDPKHPHHLDARKPDEYYINMFNETGCYPEGTTFSRNNEKKDKMGCFSYWDVTCPVCREDEYSKAGFTNTFTCSNVSLRKGAKPCRCYKGYAYNEEERRFKLDSICKHEGHKFKGFEGEWQGQFTYLLWECKEGHTNRTTVDNFLDGVRCPSCYHNIPRQQNGYYPERLNDQDSLYVLRFTKGIDTFIKVGRTFIDTKYPRSLELKRIVKADSVDTLLKVQSRHENIWYLENKVLDNFRENYRKSFKKPFKGSSECLKSEITDEVLDYIYTLIKGDSRFKILEVL